MEDGGKVVWEMMEVCGRCVESVGSFMIVDGVLTVNL